MGQHAAARANDREIEWARAGIVLYVRHGYIIGSCCPGHAVFCEIKGKLAASTGSDYDTREGYLLVGAGFIQNLQQLFVRLL